MVEPKQVNGVHPPLTEFESEDRAEQGKLASKSDLPVIQLSPLCFICQAVSAYLVQDEYGNVGWACDDHRPVVEEAGGHALAELDIVRHPKVLDGWIYAIQAEESSLVKIGWALDIGSRLDRLQTANAQRLTVVFQMPGTRWQEKRLHERLCEWSVRGEWFDPAVLDVLCGPEFADTCEATA